jgi:hypothetical protein
LIISWNHHPFAHFSAVAGGAVESVISKRSIPFTAQSDAPMMKDSEAGAVFGHDVTPMSANICLMMAVCVALIGSISVTAEAMTAQNSKQQQMADGLFSGAHSQGGSCANSQREQKTPQVLGILPLPAVRLPQYHRTAADNVSACVQTELEIVSQTIGFMKQQ